MRDNMLRRDGMWQDAKEAVKLWIWGAVLVLKMWKGRLPLPSTDGLGNSEGPSSPKV